MYALLSTNDSYEILLSVIKIEDNKINILDDIKVYRDPPSYTNLQTIDFQITWNNIINIKLDEKDEIIAYTYKDKLIPYNDHKEYCSKHYSKTYTESISIKNYCIYREGDSYLQNNDILIRNNDTGNILKKIKIANCLSKKKYYYNDDKLYVLWINDINEDLYPYHKYMAKKNKNYLSPIDINKEIIMIIVDVKGNSELKKLNLKNMIDKFDIEELKCKINECYINGVCNRITFILIMLYI